MDVSIDDTVENDKPEQVPEDHSKSSSSAEEQNFAIADLVADNPAFTSDNFRMWDMKVKPCPRARPHDWTICPFAHPGEKATRRDPRKFIYSAVACAEWKKTGHCARGDACCFSHGVFECWLHPTRYRTQLCADGMECKRRVCFFAHQESELRHPENCFVPPNKAGAASGAAASGPVSQDEMQKQLIKAITGLLGNQQQAMRQQTANMLRQSQGSGSSSKGTSVNSSSLDYYPVNNMPKSMHSNTTTSSSKNSSSTADVNAVLAKALRNLTTGSKNPIQSNHNVAVQNAYNNAAMSMSLNGPPSLVRHSVDIGSLGRFPGDQTGASDLNAAAALMSQAQNIGGGSATASAYHSFAGPSTSLAQHQQMYGASLGSLSLGGGSYGAELSTSSGWPAGEGFAAAQHWFENGGASGAQASNSRNASSSHVRGVSMSSLTENNKGSSSSLSSGQLFAASGGLSGGVYKEEETSPHVSFTLPRSGSPSCGEEGEESVQTESIQTESSVEHQDVNEILKAAGISRVFSFDNLLAELPRSASQVQLAI